MLHNGLKMLTWLLILVTLSHVVQCTLVAKYNMGGIYGTITFDQASPGNDIVISLNLKRKADNTTPSGNFKLALHQYRVNYDVSDLCSTVHIGDQIGSPITDITSGLGTITVIPNNIDLSGTKSIEGRTFVFTDDATTTICAPVEADTEYITAFAHLPANLGGSVIFRQRSDSPDAETIIYTNLFHVASTTVTTPLKWQINNGVVAMDINADTAIADRCGSTIGNMYDPTSGGGATCDTTNQDRCKIGDLSSKHGDITVPTAGSMGFYADINLPLSGTHSIIGKTIAFIDGATYYACANIVQYPFMKAKATFSNEGVKGYIKIQQKSPLDVALIEVDLENLQYMAGGYHIHNFPVPQKLEQGETICDGTHVSGHFNPFNINTATDPAAGVGTPDQYEVGDLSGKYGSLAARTGYRLIQGADPNIQLFGKNNVIGRSMVIHKNEVNSPRWICSTIWPDVAMTTAIARFTYPAIGYIILRQPLDMWYAETQVYVELNYGERAAETVNHNWYIGEAPMGDDMLSQTSRCESTGSIYNPYSVNDVTSGAHNHFRSMLGDLSSKHGKLKIRTASAGPQKVFYTDMQLPLSGPQSVIGKSMVIDLANSGSGRLACANIFEKRTRTAAVTRWTSADGESDVTGSITFQQDATDILPGMTSVSVQLSGLNQLAGGYHVHQYPTSFPSTGACSGVDVGGHMNPFSAPYPGPVTGTHDQYEIGDLSGKFNPLSGNTVSEDLTDMNLPMEGPLSIIGRSIVIHKNETGAPRWVCGNIEETSEGSELIQAMATFNEAIFGTIHLQQYRYSNGDTSDTIVTMDVGNADGTTTTGHNWHVHSSPITGDCSTAGPHYNPYMVDVGTTYSECNLLNPLRCEMGDQSRKLGQYDIGSGKKLHTDVNLPLNGIYSAAKRSIVIHAANGGSSRIACADLVPYGKPSDETYDLHFLNVAHIRSAVETTVAASVSTSGYNVQVADITSDNVECSVVRIYFLGPNAKQLRKLFKDVATSNNHQTLGDYAPSPQCNRISAAGTVQLPVILIVASILCLWLS